MRSDRLRNTVIPGSLACLLAAAAANAQVADNVYNASSGAPATLSFQDLIRWTTGGPGSWSNNGQDVGGSINFDLSTPGVDVTIEEVFGLLNGITSITTTGGDTSSSLTLSGPGTLGMSDDSGRVVIAPTAQMIFDVDVTASGELLIDASGVESTVTAPRTITFARDLVLTGSDSVLTFTNLGGSGLLSSIVFESQSLLSLNGSMVIGTEGDPMDMASVIFEGTSQILGSIDLFVYEGSIIDFGGTGSAGTVSSYEFESLNGNGTILNSSGSVDILVNGGFESHFAGNFNLVAGSSLIVSGEDTVLVLGAGETATAPATSIPTGNRIEAPGGFLQQGGLFVNDGATVLITPVLPGVPQLPTLVAPVTVNGGGTFGGNGQVDLSGFSPITALTINDGWLLGGDRLGQGTLLIGGAGGSAVLTNFGADAGLWVYYDHSTYQPGDPSAHVAPYFEATSILNFQFLPNTNIHVELLYEDGDPWISTETRLTLLSNGSQLGNTFVNATLGLWDATTNLVTRQIEIETDTQGGAFSELYATIQADYQTPAGDFQSIGQSLNALIPDAVANPNGASAELLSWLDARAQSQSSYQSAIALGLLPQSEHVAERVTADSMYFNVTRRNLREVAIGTRAPGMIKSSDRMNPALLAGLQEESAVQITRGRPKEKQVDSDVFQTLFVDGWGRWEDMDGVASVVGYSATRVGVAAGWGVALADGITLGINAGWENIEATLDGSLGDTTVNSFRGTPFISWSGVTEDYEQYAIFSIGGGYNTADGTQESPVFAESNYSLDGWEFDVEGAVGARIALSETFALQPEASLRYSLLNYSGSVDQPGGSSQYSGGDFSLLDGRIGMAGEWLLAPELRVSCRGGYQGQYIDYGNASFSLPGGLPQVSADAGNGNVSQFYTGVQLLWAPSWNTSISVGYDGAFGDGQQNGLSGGLLIRF